MTPVNEKPLNKKEESDQDDPTKPFANSAKRSAAEVNRAGDARSRNYLNKDDAGPEGPNFDVLSKDAEGDTSQNAGVFKWLQTKEAVCKNRLFYFSSSSFSKTMTVFLSSPCDPQWNLKSRVPAQIRQFGNLLEGPFL